MENVFRSRAAAKLHVEGIRDSFIQLLLKAMDERSMFSCQTCSVRFGVVALFTQVRIHHHLRTMTAEWKEEESKKRMRKRKRSLFQHQWISDSWRGVLLQILCGNFFRHLACKNGGFYSVMIPVRIYSDTYPVKNCGILQCRTCVPIPVCLKFLYYFLDFFLNF